MYKKFWQFLYSYLVFPLFLVTVHLAAVFSRKIKNGLYPRYKSINKVKIWIEKEKQTGKIFLFHAASMGEFEHIKPLLKELSIRFHTINVVTFFSPSGFENIKRGDGLDFKMYMPVDTKRNWQNLYQILKPSLLVISKHDVWPQQIWQAKKMKIPVFLVNASLAEKSSRTRPGVKRFLKHVYRDFNKIFAISDEDARRFAKHYPRCPVETIGDTKYDQVVNRKNDAFKDSLFPTNWQQKKWVFVAGSIWPEDNKHLFPALKNMLAQFENFNCILVPHQPAQKIVDYMIEEFNKWGTIKFSQREKIKNERVVILDAVGYLASIYRYASAAYVGGSFQQGIHNVMEPAIFGIPVLYGPVHKNSYEAIQFSNSEGGLIVQNEKDIENILHNFIGNETERKLIGEKAKNFALKNTGATEKLIQFWKNMLDE